MSGAELLPKWSSAKQESFVSKSNDGLGGNSFNFRVLKKDYVALHARISNLIFFSVLLGTGAILGVVSFLSAIGYLTNSESGFLPTGFMNARSVDGDSILMPHPVDLASLSDVHHNMNDTELLWYASVTASRRGRSVTPRLAFLFLTRGPLPLRPLWERYFKGHGDLYSIYIHAHPNFMPNFPSDSVFYRRNIPSEEVSWGKLSVFAAERRLLANALLDPSNERFVLLSESCIPITPFPVAYKYFMGSDHSFVDVFFQSGKGGMQRYTRIKDSQKLNPEIAPEQWRKGSQWFEMSREMAVLVVADTKYYPKFQDILCKGDCNCYIDEHYLATVLTILAPSKLANRSAMYFDFSGHTAHPKQWKEDLNELTLKEITTGHNCTYNGKPTETCHIFARKFGPGAVKPLLELAGAILGIP